MKKYFAIIRGAFMVGMVYRLGFIFTILGNLVYLGVAYYLWTSIYETTNVMRGLTFNEAFLYIALGSAVFILLKTYSDWWISREIIDGNIIIDLIKPIDYQLMTLFTNLGFVLTNLIAITIPTALMLVLVFNVTIPYGAGTLLFPFSLIMAFVISYCFDYFTGLLAFYTESTWGLSITKDTIILVFSGALVPLQFFPEGMQKVLMVLPFQTMYHTPLMLFTRPDQPWEALAGMLLVQCGWALGLILLTRLFYLQAIKVLRISGG
ncbi:MAG: ABC-2 family transporter protein [Anaerolineales bacterium]|nr:ABC-2 family transporter protein [Anaerolineales bacterium]